MAEQGPEHEQLLLEIRRRARKARSAPRPPQWKSWEFGPWEEEQEHGPRFSVTGWFGRMPDRQRMRYVRALADLEHGKLVEPWRPYDTRITHVKLTPAGLKAAEELLAERAKAEPTARAGR